MNSVFTICLVYVNKDIIIFLFIEFVFMEFVNE